MEPLVDMERLARAEQVLKDAGKHHKRDAKWHRSSEFAHFGCTYGEWLCRSLRESERLRREEYAALIERIEALEKRLETPNAD
jgi:hypothetical protein